jgi:hypothetical protein
MVFSFKLEDEDGAPADPPAHRTVVPNWRPGDTIPFGRKTFRVVAVRRPEEQDGDPVLVVEDPGSKGH